MGVFYLTKLALIKMGIKRIGMMIYTHAHCGGKTNLVKISESTFALKVEKEK